MSHEATSRGIRFEADQLLDGNDRTSWQYDLTETNGKEPCVILELGEPAQIHTLLFKNGYWKISSGYDQYGRNGRVKDFEVSFRKAGSTEFTAPLSFRLEDRKEEQLFELGAQVNVEAVRITIQSIYVGSRFPDDVAINELALVGVPGLI